MLDPKVENAPESSHFSRFGTVIERNDR